MTIGDLVKANMLAGFLDWLIAVVVTLAGAVVVRQVRRRRKKGQTTAPRMVVHECGNCGTRMRTRAVEQPPSTPAA
jgi:hypothetical protein